MIATKCPDRAISGPAELLPVLLKPPTPRGAVVHLYHHSETDPHC
jgi:hypothetical protein